ncbi:hypothetical protein GZ998_06450 [Actinomyces sp. 594]|uniref:SRPBCC family protein n=1 Tax=Actinomyces sp. 594 TaxID=2057793 RepID=UPI001C595189|nr:SRPBCC family protein [Actinomyces sp. 594]MBW3069149.1 hypothetical protein [Actinomyces sp. 594]
MTKPRPTHLWSWISCARHEAGRLQHPEIDIDHLLLGLLAQGGEAAALLGAHGVTLANARRAMHEVAAADLAALGIDAAAIPASLQSPGQEAQRLADSGDIPLSGQAQQFAHDRRNDFSTSLSALKSLLGLDGGAPMRILAHLDVNTERLRADLDTHEEVTCGTPGVAKVDHDLLPETPSAALRLSRFISAPPEQVHAVLADPGMLTGWAVLPAEVCERYPDGIVSQHRSRNRRRQLNLRWRHLELGTDTMCWVKTILTGPYDGQTHSYDGFVLRPAPGGCELTFTRAYRVWRLSGRLLHPAIRRLTRIGMVNTLGAIARTVAGSR